MTDKMNTTRRDFLKSTARASAGLAALGGLTVITQPERVFGANDRVRLAVIGVRSRGFDHIEGYARVKTAEIAAICDVDENVIARRVGDMQKMGLAKPATFTDVRKLLEDKTLDAVSIATPNHWHSLMAIWACQAGKDVYVEKPCSHNLWEGQQLVRAAEKYGRMVQHGTQSRSASAMIEMQRRLGEGVIGDLYLARGTCYKWRNTIGHAAVEPVPKGVDYEMWTGPAPMKPFTKNRFHYNWHWIWDTGNGDLGNQGIHQVDVARWGMGLKFPNRVSAIGGHFMFDDDQETPNTVSCAFEYNLPDGKKKMIEFEVRHWITNHEAEIGTPALGTAAPPPRPPGAREKLGPTSGRYSTIGDIFYGSSGYLACGDEDADTFKTWLGEEQEPGPTAHAGGDHYANFVDCVRSRKKEALNAPIEEGHISCALVHLANASYRLGRTLNFDPETQQVIGDDEANQLLRDAGRGYRPPFVVPEQV
jgi:predicted dehydrogenase